MTECEKESNFILVQGGEFIMGDTVGDGEPDEKPTHRVVLDSFYMNKYKSTGPGAGLNVSWYGAIIWANYLSKLEGLPPYYHVKVWEEGEEDWQGYTVNYREVGIVEVLGGGGYRLPTEAEWEYAARGGNKSKGYKYSGSDDLQEVAWNRNGAYIPGQNKANELGIYDMSGDGLEWCYDSYNKYESSAQINPIKDYGFEKVCRGSGHITRRCSIEPEYTNTFRLVRSHESCALNKVNIIKPGNSNHFSIYYGTYNELVHYLGNIKNGISKIKYNNGTYEGQFSTRDGRHGFGMLVYENGDKYIGCWEHNRFSGYGIHFISGGDRYEGNWGANGREGYGKYIWANGDRYEGNWEKNKETNGLKTTANGSKKEIKNGKEAGCFISTAICKSLGKDDECYELRTLRNYRDTWLSIEANGIEIIEEYYRIAPFIVDIIDRNANSSYIYLDIYNQYLIKCLYFIEKELNEAALLTYKDMVYCLKELFYEVDK